MEIKDVIKARRLELGLTMLDIAQKVGVSEATISRWESGDIANMRRDKIVSLARALEISPSVIMGWNDTRSAEVKVYTNDEHHLLTLYNQLNDVGQQQLIEQADTLVSSGKYIKTKTGENCG